MNSQHPGFSLPSFSALREVGQRGKVRFLVVTQGKVHPQEVRIKCSYRGWKSLGG